MCTSLKGFRAWIYFEMFLKGFLEIILRLCHVHGWFERKIDVLDHFFDKLKRLAIDKHSLQHFSQSTCRMTVKFKNISEIP